MRKFTDGPLLASIFFILTWIKVFFENLPRNRKATVVQCGVSHQSRDRMFLESDPWLHFLVSMATQNIVRWRTRKGGRSKCIFYSFRCASLKEREKKLSKIVWSISLPSSSLSLLSSFCLLSSRIWLSSLCCWWKANQTVSWVSCPRSLQSVYSSQIQVYYRYNVIRINVVHGYYVFLQVVPPSSI